MKYGRRMRGGDEAEVVESTSDMMTPDSDMMADVDVMGDADMSVDQSGGKHRHSKRCKHSKKGKRSMRKRSMRGGEGHDMMMGGKKRRSTKRRSTKRRSTKRRSMKKGKKSMRKGGGVLETAAVPLGLFGLHRYFGKHSLKKMVNKLRK